MLNQKNEQSAIDIDRPVILVIEDDDSIGTFLVEALSQETPYKAILVTDGLQALQIAHSIKPSLVITDYRLPNLNGIELYDMFQSLHPLKNTPTILMSAQLPTQEVRKRNLIALNKPFELDDLLTTVERLLAA